MIVFSFFLSGQWQADGKWFTLFWGTSEIFPGPLLFANGISFYPFRGPGEMHCARIHCKYRRDFTFLSPPSISAFIMCIDATPRNIVLKSLIVWRLSLSQRLGLIFSPSSSSWTFRLKCGEIRGFFFKRSWGSNRVWTFSISFRSPFCILERGRRGVIFSKCHVALQDFTDWDPKNHTRMTSHWAANVVKQKRVFRPFPSLKENIQRNVFFPRNGHRIWNFVPMCFAAPRDQIGVLI